MAGSVKKKTNRRLKRSVRRTLGALCMITAIIVAAIPFPDSAAGSGTSGQTGYPYTYAVSETTDYLQVNDTLNQTKEISSDVDYSKKNPTYASDNHTAYTIYKNSTGAWQMDWQFEYYAPANQTSGSNVIVMDGLITSYNANYSKTEVDLSYQVYSDYIYITQDDYSKFLAKDNTSEKIKVNAYKNMTADKNSPTEADCKIYQAEVKTLYYPYIINETPDYYNDNPNDPALLFFKQNRTLKAEYEEYISQYYAYLDYQNYLKAIEGKTSEEIAGIQKVNSADKPATLRATYGDDVYKTDAERTQFFCDQVFGGGTEMELIGVSVKDSGELVYVPKITQKPNNKPVSINGKLYWVDSNLFLADNTNTIAGIAKDAFKGVKNVTTLTMAPEIDFIGDSAFEDSFVQSITFEKGAKIGNAAFKGCPDLVNVDMTKGVKEIGAEAFSGTPVEDIVIPNTVETVGAGAFYNCKSLKQITFNKTGGTEIKKYAFFDCPALENVSFGTSTIKSIGECVFALSQVPTGTLKEVYMPDSITSGSDIGKYLFGGRTNLQSVTMPTNLGAASESKLDSTIFYGCSNLKEVIFPETCYNVTFDDTIFKDVKNPEFCVRGPKTDGNGGTALPRKSTWPCTFGDTSEGQEPQPVPYVYKDGKEEYYEICDSAGYLSVINGKGTLISSSFMPGANKDDIGSATQNPDGTWTVSNAYEIPAKVGTTSVVSLAEGCFDGTSGILDYIVALKIADGSGIKSIGDEVFRNADKLKYVYIGSGVSSLGKYCFADDSKLEYVELGNTITDIGEGAFENDPELTYIKLNVPEGNFVPDVTIGTNAFSTGSDKLTIEGLIDGDYGPFKWAMDPDCFMDPDKGVRVLYKSPEPQNMSVILDNKNNMPTLVDYPRFEDLDKELRKRYEDGEAFDVNEANLIDACININIPDGIKSIDAKGFFNNESIPADGVTVNKGLNNEYSIKAYFYDNNSLKDRYQEYKDGGLFSSDGSSFDEYTDPASTEKHEKEQVDAGNDRIQSVTMASVEYLPDGAFYSCEALTSVLFSNDMKDVGSLPFEGCTGLLSVGGSSSYSCNNGILYKNDENGIPVTLVECLASRGTENGPGVSTVSIKNDPDLLTVTEIEPGAFRNCEELISVDFYNGGTCKFKEIPKECFKGDTLLAFAYLPESVTYIGEDAFADTGKSTDVWVYSRTAVLGDNVYGSGDEAVAKPKLTAYEDAAIRQQAKDKGIDVSEVIPEDGSLTVTFFVRQGSGLVQVGKVTGILSGSNIRKEAPDEVDLASYIKNGYELTGWEGTQDLTNITESGFFVAKIEAKDTDGDGIPDIDDKYPLDPDNKGDGSGNSGNNGNNGSNGSNGTNGSNGSNGNNGTNGTNGSNGSNNSVSNNDSVKKYTLTVVYGNGSGTYASGSTVIISAIEPPAGKEFYKWTSNNTGVTITSATSAATTVKTTSSDAVITATYRDKSSVSSNSINRKPIGSTSDSSSGSTVEITKSGISNTDKAYASVSGSTDNFIVKITESSEAANAVALALSNEYADMNPIRYFAMDISLYDKNGNKVTDTNGLSVNVTMPIPDALVQYGGNNKVGAVVNGNTLEKLNCKFTTVSGIPCVTFTATHFSPYTIYVDTSNLSANMLDVTPKTGDGIHPKWFFSIGLACISILLFMKKDRVSPAKARIS